MTTTELHALLDHSSYAVEEAILRIYDRQESDEQASRMTRHANGVGFSAFDADFMSSLAEQIRANRWGRPKGGRLTPKQMVPARRKIKRYSRQLLEIANAKAALAERITMAPALALAALPGDGDEDGA